MSEPLFRDLPEEVCCIDTGFMQPGLAASYLIGSTGRYAFVETGTALAVPRLLQALTEKGVAREAVDYVIPTHVHLDHAGGAGALLRELPGARLVVHPRGARHMIDPAKLTAGARAVYGEEGLRRDSGEIVPVAGERVIEAPDGFTLELGGRRLEFLDTPGHAAHHFCVWDARSGGFFTGDTFGMSLRCFDTAGQPFVYLPSAPVQFDPGTWHATLDRLMRYAPRCMYLTHFSRVGSVERLAAELHAELDAYVELAGEHFDEGGSGGARLRSALRDRMISRLRAHGYAGSEGDILARVGMDIEINAQGLEVWARRQAAAYEP